MQVVILDDIKVELPLDGLLKRLRMGENSPQLSELQDLIREAESIGKPKVLCGVAQIEERGEDYLVIDGVRFSSRELVARLEGVDRVFPALSTCGTELEAWSKGLEDILYSFWSEAILEVALRNAQTAVATHLRDAHGQEDTSRVGPGTLNDWPLEEQEKLFRLFGDTEASVGVRLTESMLMLPAKSVSSIYFPSRNGA